MEFLSDEVNVGTVVFDLDGDDLDRLQEEEWDYFDECHNSQFHAAVSQKAAVTNFHPFVKGNLLSG
ncbi:Hypothetical protein PHPALM_14092 [Phytophthora palmivora]|uniref:Uncharacterized protein n=1 Tax=Phytophthora palmivora TaxID=4796 RepID=A0A2P4XVM8_9STRA|nr:Hypothetical protein PHPALM_14092 [Phytophthora palmivora]